MIKVLVLVATLLSVTASSADAKDPVYYLTGEDLYQLCRSPNPTKLGECYGYLEGIVDAGNEDLGNHPTCVGGDAKIEQLRDVVVTYLRDRAAPDRKLFAAFFVY